MNYQIVYCFVKNNGEIEIDKSGNEHYYIDFELANSPKEAVERMKKKENFIVMPEIISVVQK